jgi:AcrR family transcriptional regulator
MSTRREGTRSRLLGAARALFEERGYHDVGLEEIGAAAGVSRQAVYLHFGSKAQLLVALFSWIEEQEHLGELLAPVFASPDGVEALSLLVDAHSRFEPGITKIADVAEAARRTAPEMDELVRGRMELRLQGMRQIVARIHAQGRLRSDWTVDDAAGFVWTLLSPESHRLLVRELGWSNQRWATGAKRLLLDALVDPGDRDLPR